MARKDDGYVEMSELIPSGTFDDVFEYPRHEFNEEILLKEADEDDPVASTYVTATGYHLGPPRDIYVKIPSTNPNEGPSLVPLKDARDLKSMTKQSISSQFMRSPRGVNRLGPVEALFIVETTPYHFPFDVGTRDYYFHVLNQTGHIVYFAAAEECLHRCCLYSDKLRVDVFDFDGTHVVLFDMEKSAFTFYIRIHSALEKFGTIRHHGCSLKFPTFHIRNKHFRNEFLAQPYHSSKHIPHEYIILGFQADGMVARIAKKWGESDDSFPNVQSRSVNPNGEIYGIVFTHRIMMFQKLNLLALVFAIKFIHHEFDEPPEDRADKPIRTQQTTN